MPDSQGLVVVGRVVRPHGIRGEVAVEVLSDRPERFEPGSILRGEGRSLVVETSRPHKGRLLVRFESVADRTAAERLRGLTLEAEPLEPAETDTYFAHELMGMRVRDEDGADLGAVAAMIELPPVASYDLLEIARGDGTSWLLPATDEYVDVEVTADGTAFLRLSGAPEGLTGEPGDGGP